jgi:hypothetical protein
VSTGVVITRAAVYRDGRLVARLLWSGRMLKVENLRGRGLGRLLPAGYTQGRPDDGSGLYDLWTAKHPHVHVPSDRILAGSRTMEDCIALAVEGALASTRLQEDIMSNKDLFDHIWHSDRHGGWVTELRTSGEWAVVPVSSLVGEVLNVGDKNGGVYEGVTLTAFDEHTGYLTLEGGITGSAYRPEESRPLERPERLWAHDVARGYVRRQEDDL